MPSVSVNVSTTGAISCSPDPVQVPASSPNATITFTLTNSAYSFRATNAIVVPSPSNQFPNPSSTVSPTAATLFDVNSDTNSYKYVVHLVRNSDSEALAYDPTIENGK